MQANYKDEDFFQNEIFVKLETLKDFYNKLSFNVMGFISLSLGTGSIFNIDTYVYSSLRETLDSIELLLKKKKMSDAYTLLRKYYDVAITNIYINLYHKNNHSSENMVVEKVKNWIIGKEDLPRTKTIFDYIQTDRYFTKLNATLSGDKRYDSIRKRLNDFVHSNTYSNVLVNDGEIHLRDRILVLNKFKDDLEDIFILHFAYLFLLCEHYMMDSNYKDCLDLGLQPEEGSENWVAPYVGDIFQNIVSKRRPDIANLILKETTMDLKEYS